MAGCQRSSRVSNSSASSILGWLSNLALNSTKQQAKRWQIAAPPATTWSLTELTSSTVFQSATRSNRRWARAQAKLEWIPSKMASLTSTTWKFTSLMTTTSDKTWSTKWPTLSRSWTKITLTTSLELFSHLFLVCRLRKLWNLNQWLKMSELEKDAILRHPQPVRCLNSWCNLSRGKNSNHLMLEAGVKFPLRCLCQSEMIKVWRSQCLTLTVHLSHLNAPMKVEKMASRH